MLAASILIPLLLRQTAEEERGVEEAARVKGEEDALATVLSARDNHR